MLIRLNFHWHGIVVVMLYLSRDGICEVHYHRVLVVIAMAKNVS